MGRIPNQKRCCFASILEHASMFADPGITLWGPGISHDVARPASRARSSDDARRMKCNPLDSDYRQIQPDGIQNQSFCIVHALPGKDQSECNTRVPPPAARPAVHAQASGTTSTMARTPRPRSRKKKAVAKPTVTEAVSRPVDRRRKAAAPELASKKARSTPSKRDYRRPTPGSQPRQ